jgi:hypothetical protein
MTDDFEKLVRERAYQLWEQEGRCDGRAEEHWHAAHRELASRSEAPPAAPANEPAAPASGAKRPRRRTAAPAAVAAETIAPSTPRRRRSTTPTLQ